jgi:hypothetical protein
VAIFANNEPVKPQLRKTKVASANASREHILNRHPYSVHDLFFVKLLVFAAGVRVCVGRAQQNLRKPEFLLTRVNQTLAGKNAQVDRRKSHSLSCNLQDQHSRIHAIVNRLLGVLGGESDFCCSSKKLSFPDLFLIRAGGGNERG